MRRAKSLDGIISSLTRKHGGNVHEKGIVTVTSKSTAGQKSRNAPQNCADLTHDSYSFESNNAPGQWVCWDFGDVLVGLTGYTIRAWKVKSWILEGSLDGETWTEIDQVTGNEDFKEDMATASFTLPKPAECRFIRLTQSDKKHNGTHVLNLQAVEFFGTLYW
jgi:hypothetical protein